MPRTETRSSVNTISQLFSSLIINVNDSVTISNPPAPEGKIITSETDTTLNDISVLVDNISGLIGKLGNFNVIWEKVRSASTSD